MAARYEYLITGDHDAGTKVVMDALAASGYVFESADDGWTTFSRGDVMKTTLLGVLAGEDFYVAFLVGFSSGRDGHLVARIERDLVLGALKGGWLGAARTGRAFDEAVADVRSAVERAGILHAHGEPAG